MILVPVITSAGRLCFGCVYLSVCANDFSKSNKRIFMRFFMSVQPGQEKEVITFWERSGSYSEYKRNPKVLEMAPGRRSC